MRREASGEPLAKVLLVLAAALGVGVLGFLAAATKRLGYKRVGPEAAQLGRAENLQACQAQLGLVEADFDEAVSLDLRERLLEDYADVIPYNRQLTLQRYVNLARATSCLLLSLFFALLATMLALMTPKTGLLPKA